MLSIINEIVSRKSLIRELVVKDLKVRYSRPAIGFFWAFLSPFLTVIVYYVVFHSFLKVEIRDAPFVLYLMTAVFSWRFFQDSLICSVSSLVENKNLIREANFPHYLIPLCVVLSNAAHFAPSLAILLSVSFFLLKGLPVLIVFLPLILMMHLIITFGLSLIFSILYVRWRDIKYLLETALLLFFYLIPAFYPVSLARESLPPVLFKLYGYNPLVSILNLYRYAILNGFYGASRGEMNLFVSLGGLAIVAVAVFTAGTLYYRSTRNKINDYLSC